MADTAAASALEELPEFLRGCGLEESASSAGLDGRSRVGSLEDRTVNIKWYMKHQGLLDTPECAALEYYLILTGSPSPAGSSRGSIRPWCIQSVYLFDARQLRAEQEARGVKRGIVSSVTKQQWAAAEIYPAPISPLLPVIPTRPDCSSSSVHDQSSAMKKRLNGS